MIKRYIVKSSVVIVLLGAAGLAAAGPYDADIRWTQYGVPHIKAKDYASLGYGYGYAVAKDRLCLLADRVITLRGERSRWFGATGAATVGFLPASNHKRPSQRAR